MKKIVVTSLLVLAVGVALALTGVAQNAATAPTPVRSSVAVVDVGKIMTEWKYVAARQEDLKKQFEPKFEPIKARAEQLQKDYQVLKTMKRGTPEYVQMENSIIRKEQDIKTDDAILRKQADEQEAKIYQDAYKYIKQHAAFYAKQIGATCVIQVNTADEFQVYNPRVPAANLTLQEVSARQVVWYDGAINVTDQILTRLNAAATTQSNSARPTTSR
ncbi:MAG: OmpH family outer membrane protein [Thermoguttaceae bacterium]|nr:OmpH family outer membrane protein [Thermoguttaceae bacterium]